MRLIWTSHAKANLKEIVSYIGADNPAAARKIKSRIESLAAILVRQPFMGRPGAVPGAREAIPHPSYRMVYQLDGETVFALVHTARQWPPTEGEGD